MDRGAPGTHRGRHLHPGLSQASPDALLAPRAQPRAAPDLALRHGQGTIHPATVTHVRGEGMKIGNRVPETYFETTGSGESDVTIHAGSYHLALREAGIEMANIMTYSSILPATARRIAYPGRDAFTHGEVMESIVAQSSCGPGERATAGVIYGWLIDPITQDRKSTRLNSSHGSISYDVFCLKSKRIRCRM